jgi:hypothetical protein
MQVKNYFLRVFVSLSLLLNAICGGLIGQTFSAAQHERKRDNRLNLSVVIDFVLGKYHCQGSWIKWVIREKEQ